MPYIDRKALDMAFTMLRFNGDGTLRHWDDRLNWCMSGQEVEDLINSIPTADVVEVKHGDWIPILEINENGEPYQAGVYCSECGDAECYEPYFCPNCGADMRKETEDGRLD